MKNILVLIFLIASFSFLSPELLGRSTISYLPNSHHQVFQSWALERNKKYSINLDKAHRIHKPKKVIKVAVIDTGIDPEHPYLKGNVIRSQRGRSTFGHDVSVGSEHPNRPFDYHGHGTHIAGIIKSVHPKVKILAIKYFNPFVTGKENLRATIKAIRTAIENKVDIINFSGGGRKFSLEERVILQEAGLKGILVITAAGNEGKNLEGPENNFYPAEYNLNHIVSVNAHNKYLGPTDSSNFGTHIDISAPGTRIKAPYPNGRAAYLTGTSQATAFVTGVAALLKSHFPKLKPRDLRKILMKSSRKEESLLRHVNRGGRLDAYRAMVYAQWFFSKKKPLRGLAHSKEVFSKEFLKVK